MANNASNLSTVISNERYYTPQQQQFYDKKLISTAAHPVAQADVSGDGLALARSLGVLGDALGTEAANQTKRREEIGIAEADRIISGRSEKEMQTLNAIDMLNTYSDYDMADNPYAVSLVEKLRGKYLGASARNSYQSEVVDKEGYVQGSSVEEVARYNKFMQDKYTQVLGNNSSDVKAFQKGFFDSHIADQLDVANAQIKAKSQDMKAVLLGSVQADLGKVIEKGYSLTNEDASKSVNDIFANTRLSGLKPEERIALWKSFAGEFADRVGNADMIKHMAENVVLGVDSQGKPIKAGEVSDLTQPYKMANVRKAQMGESNVTDIVTKLAGGKKEDVALYYDNLKQTDPNLYDTMVPFRSHIENAIDTTEKKRLLAQQKASNSQYAMSMAKTVGNRQLAAFISGNTKDAQGYTTATSFESLPRFNYTEMDANGDPVTKQYTWKQSDILSLVDNQVAYIAANTADPTERAKQLMKVFTWGPAKAISDSLKMRYGSAINHLSPEVLGTDENGNAVISGEAQNAMEMYNVAPEDFLHIMGPEVTKDVETIKMLTEASGGDARQGVGAFVNAKDKMRNDPELCSSVRVGVEKQLATQTMDGFMGLDGNPVTADQSLPSNANLMERVRGLATALVLGGQSVENATNFAIQRARETNYVWGDAAMPRSIFNGIAAENRTEYGVRVLDYYKAAYAQKANIDPSYVAVSWDDNRHLLRFSGGTTAPTVYTPDQIAWSGNDLIRQDIEAMRQRPQNNITHDQYNTEADRIQVRNAVQEQLSDPNTFLTS